jgi:hypothetical protein
LKWTSSVFLRVGKRRNVQRGSLAGNDLFKERFAQGT